MELLEPKAYSVKALYCLSGSPAGICLWCAGSNVGNGVTTTLRKPDLREGLLPQSPAHPRLVPAELATVVRRFSQTGIQDFLTLTLTEQTGLLYVGAREALFAFSVEALELQGVVRGGGVGGMGWGWGAANTRGLHVGCSPQLESPHPFSSPAVLTASAAFAQLGLLSSTGVSSQRIGTTYSHLVSLCCCYRPCLWHMLSMSLGRC